MWERVGRVAPYGAAFALSPYVVIKASWVIGSLVGAFPVGAGFSTAGWVVLNTTTIGMASAGILVALAMVRPWGMRVPGRPLGLCAWVGAGFLVPLLPFAILSSVFVHTDTAKAKASGDAVMPGWEAVLVQIGFVGMGLGLALGLPVYLRRRWPAAFAGEIGVTGTVGATGTAGATGSAGAAARSRGLRGAILGSAFAGAVWLSWAAGSRLGVSHTDKADATWRVLDFCWGGWAVIAGGAVYVLARKADTVVPRGILAAAAWLGTGSLFAWSGWKLALTLYLMIARPDNLTFPENLGVAAVVHAIAIASGATLARALALGVVRDRAQAGAISALPEPCETRPQSPLP